MSTSPVLLTRPRAQIRATAEYLEGAGWSVITLPLIKIEPPARKPTPRQIAFAEQADWMIFTSRHAVTAASQIWPHWPGAKIAAIGQATARALQQAGWPVHWQAPDANSESLLLASAAPDFSGQNVALMSGSGGRRQLKQLLLQRQCRVEKLLLYRRAQEHIDFQQAQYAIQRGAIALFTSGYAMRQWTAYCKQHRLEAGLKLDLLVASPRLCKLAHQLGFCGRIQALAKVSDAALLDALTQWNS